MVPYHHGCRFPAEAQFGEKGWAYVPYGRVWAIDNGVWFSPADAGWLQRLRPGMHVIYAWTSGSAGDHVETVIAVYADGTFDTAGYNTGTPEGCHVPIRRNTKYVLGFVDSYAAGFITDQPTPPPAPPTVEDFYAMPLASAVAVLFAEDLIKGWYEECFPLDQHGAPRVPTPADMYYWKITMGLLDVVKSDGDVEQFKDQKFLPIARADPDFRH